MLFDKNSSILYVCEYFPPFVMGGADISAKKRAIELSKFSKVTIFTPNYESFKTKHKKLEKVNIVQFRSIRYFLYKKKENHKKNNTYRKPSKFFYFLFNILSIIDFFIAINLYLFNKKFDILYSNNFESNIGISLIFFKGKKIAHLRDFYFFELFKDSKIISSLFIFFLRRIPTFISNSIFLKNKYQSYLPSKKIEVIYNIIGDEYKYNDSKKQARIETNLKLEKKYILFVGSFTKDKGVDFILEELIPKFPNIHFILIGDGFLFDKIKQYKYKNILLIKKLISKELAKYYRGVDLVIVPSIWEEPFGRVSLEAQINNTPVLVSNKGGLPETIRKKSLGKVIEIKDFKKEIELFFND